ncbi:amidohydrolase family protein [Mycolicibacterium litorale]|uniref:amidohydrolase family protein n=1 Tax=Mycolicibacterium litorale TaxID=758802 RepID=UPI003CF60006
MPLQDWMKIISVDDHVIEHPRVWQDRLADKHRDAGPQIIETAEGHHVWRYEGQLYPQIGLNAVAGKPPSEYGMEPVRYDQMIPGCYDPAERVKDMDIDGVHAALSFPSFPGFGGGVFQRAADKKLALECVRAWNDFQVDEWCATAPDRLIPLGILPTWDPQLAAAEVERLAQRGTRAVSFPDSPVPLGLPSFHHPTHWEVLWDAVEAADMPICLHFGAGGYVPGFSFLNPSPSDMAPFAVAIATFSTNLMWTTADLVFSGMLQRHPDIKFLLSEGGIGWIPYILERLDYTWERHRWYQNISRTDRPSDLFRKHIWGCFIDDVHGVNSRDLIGVENILIEVDYPHSDSNWPNSRKRVAENLLGVDDHDAHRIVELNARELLNFGVDR